MSKSKGTPAAVPDESDEHAGKGGSYVIGEDGRRELVARTLSREEVKSIDEDKQPKEVNDVATGS